MYPSLTHHIDSRTLPPCVIQRTLNPGFLSRMASYDMASNICKGTSELARKEDAASVHGYTGSR
jgi:hypothetical protein